VKLAQRDCISRVERRRRASRYGNLRRPEEGKRAIHWWWTRLTFSSKNWKLNGD